MVTRVRGTFHAREKKLDGAMERRRAPQRVSGYVLSADADCDLDEIWGYIAADHPFYNPPAIVSS